MEGPTDMTVRTHSRRKDFGRRLKDVSEIGAAVRGSVAVWTPMIVLHSKRLKSTFLSKESHMSLSAGIGAISRHGGHPFSIQKAINQQPTA